MCANILLNTALNVFINVYLFWWNLKLMLFHTCMTTVMHKWWYFKNFGNQNNIGGHWVFSKYLLFCSTKEIKGLNNMRESKWNIQRNCWSAWIIYKLTIQHKLYFYSTFKITTSDQRALQETNKTTRDKKRNTEESEAKCLNSLRFPNPLICLGSCP